MTAEEARDDGIRTVAASEAPFVAVAFEALTIVCSEKRLPGYPLGVSITSEDVWALLEGVGYSKPAEPRAMGPVMQRGVREGLIRPTDTFRKGTMRSRHAAPIRVYEVVR